VKELQWNLELLGPDNARICLLDQTLKEDLWEITKRCSHPRSPSMIMHIRNMGLRTLVLREGDSLLETLHKPWSESGFVFAPMITGLCYAGFQRVSQ
jgi:hypothetical protein